MSQDRKAMLDAIKAQLQKAQAALKDTPRGLGEDADNFFDELRTEIQRIYGAYSSNPATEDLGQLNADADRLADAAEHLKIAGQTFKTSLNNIKGAAAHTEEAPEPFELDPEVFDTEGHSQLEVGRHAPEKKGGIRGGWRKVRDNLDLN